MRIVQEGLELKQNQGFTFAKIVGACTIDINVIVFLFHEIIQLNATILLSNLTMYLFYSILYSLSNNLPFFKKCELLDIFFRLTPKSIEINMKAGHQYMCKEYTKNEYQQKGLSIMIQASFKPLVGLKMTATHKY